MSKARPASDGAAAPAMVPVWNRAVRAGHWALAASVLGCLWLHEGGTWHERLGYAALVLAAWRLIYGLATADGYARFSAFVRGTRATLNYAQALMAGRAPHHVGHNPLGAWMIVALLTCALAAGASGALYVTDRFWGVAAVYEVHRMAGWAFALLVPLHVGGVLLTSFLERENLLRAMFTGRKRAVAIGDTGKSGQD